MEKNRVIVQIDGREYPVASVESVEHIEQVAQLVDQKVRELRNNSVLNREIALTFACLNLADELIKLKGETMPKSAEELPKEEEPAPEVKPKRPYKRTKKADKPDPAAITEKTE